MYQLYIKPLTCLILELVADESVGGHVNWRQAQGGPCHRVGTVAQAEVNKFLVAQAAGLVEEGGRVRLALDGFTGVSSVFDQRTGHPEDGLRVEALGRQLERAKPFEVFSRG